MNPDEGSRTAGRRSNAGPIGFAGLVRALLVAGFAVSTCAIADALDRFSDAQLRADIGKITQQRIFFGHQSVGANLLDGIAALAQAAGIQIQMSEVGSAREVRSATLGHAFVARNGHPSEKLRNFAQALGTRNAPVDLAILKLCYVDFSSATDALALFNEYRASLAELRAKHPTVTFVHVTAPLTRPESGVTALVKRLVGRIPKGVLENAKREQYNAYIRSTYQGREPVFDLARIESTASDGRSVSVIWNGTPVPVLAAEYTDDGGHLNSTGRLRAAREFVSVLASARTGASP